jgi:transcriptional regulator with XRE-family HTH domain
MIKNLIIKFRKSNDFSQEELAKRMSISRPTLISIEKGKRDITLGELKNISKIFDIPVEIILNKDFSIEEKINSQDFSKKTLNKFQNLILQCIKYGSDEDGKITKTKLAKLVYLCDFASYYNFLKPISGFEYHKLARGPVAIQFFDIIDEDESICVESKGRSMMISLNEIPAKGILDNNEEDIVKSVCTKWKEKNTKEIVDFTHNQIPWKVCKDGEAIPYTLINSEAPDNVY